MKKSCSMCGSVKPGAGFNGKWICDDCMNQPERTRGLRTEAINASVSTDEAPLTGKLMLNKVVIREDDDDGEVIAIPRDGDLQPPPDAAIMAAKLEVASDPQYIPLNEKTLKRIGMELVPHVEGITEGLKATSPADESAELLVKRAPRSGARKTKKGRYNKAR